MQQLSDQDIAEFKRHFLSWAFPGVAVLSSINAYWIPRKITDDDIEDASRFLTQGTVLLSHVDWSVSNCFIPGFWTHSAMVCGQNKVIESTVYSGVHVIALEDFMRSKDYVCALQPLFADEIYMTMAASWALGQEGKPYDREMASSFKAFYCSELVCMSYVKTMGEKCPFVPRVRYGEPTCVPQDFFDATSKWKPIWLSSAYRCR